MVSVSEPPFFFSLISLSIFIWSILWSKQIKLLKEYSKSKLTFWKNNTLVAFTKRYIFLLNVFFELNWFKIYLFFKNLCVLTTNLFLYFTFSLLYLFFLQGNFFGNLCVILSYLFLLCLLVHKILRLIEN